MRVADVPRGTLPENGDSSLVGAGNRTFPLEPKSGPQRDRLTFRIRRPDHECPFFFQEISPADQLSESPDGAHRRGIEAQRRKLLDSIDKDRSLQAGNRRSEEVPEKGGPALPRFEEDHVVSA